ncbi:hypothetical protein CN495_07950 [Bacillus thuringiensis]|uniref:Uncharacterized protein n=1 Tax=Bacillus thuringiensis TaxID=1428 RepID=A0ABD6SCN0_BACTU|nr:hypothetical protein [Bacillus thuringiensis]PER55677.1 hypothetical protein CN495_07950 [Bacillus thuringiensis]
MSLFDDKEKMFIPLSIDNAEAERGNYFTSNKKMIGLFLAILPYIGLLSIFMKLGVGILPIIILTVVYLFLLSFFIRYWVFEEPRLKKMIQEKDDNVISGVDHFWGIDKVGNGVRDSGQIYYQRSEGKLKRGLVVYYDTGSTVGVPEGHYEEYRRTKNEFLRELHARGMDFQWYEVQKLPEMPKTLTRYAELLQEDNREALRMLVKLQLNINSMYTMDAEQRYVNYIVITNTRFANMRRFKKLVQDILSLTLKTNGYLKDVKICNKEEGDEFFRTILLLDSFNSSYIRKSVDMKPFNKFAKLVRIVDEDGQAVPLELLDDLEITATGKTVDDIYEEEDKKEQTVEEMRKKKRTQELETAKKIRMRGEITDEEYKEYVREIEFKYAKENYDPDLEKKKKKQKREEELAKREEMRNQRNKAEEPAQPDTEWYKNKESIEVKKVKDTQPNKIEKEQDVLGEYDDNDTIFDD